MERVEGAFAERVKGLTKRNGRLYVERPEGSGESSSEVAVSVRYLRPLTARREIAFLDEKGREVATLESTDSLTDGQGALVDEALRERYHLATIVRVLDVDTRFGTRYWNVETDRGPRWFALREPGKNVSWLDGGRLVMRDTAGNRYEIPDVAALDPRSRRSVMTSL